jgi:hypothetical protein
MTDKLSKDLHTVTVTEFEVRELDRFGDALDVKHFATLEEAKTEARRLMDSQKSVAVVVEKHISKRPARGTPDVYKPVFMLGDWKALREGGWR